MSDADVLKTIRASGKNGILAKDLAELTSLAPSALAYRLGKLRAQKKVRSTGRTSQMRYFVTGGKKS